jgi:hypothetical protein
MHINLRRFSHPKTMFGLGLFNIVAAVNWAVELWDKYDFLEGKSGVIAATLRAILNTEGGARGIFLVAFMSLVLSLLFEFQRSEPETAEASGAGALAKAERQQLEERPIPTVPFARRAMADANVIPHPKESTTTLGAKETDKKGPKPNFVCTSTEPRPARIEHDALVEGINEYRPNYNVVVVVAEITNEFLPSRKLTDIKNVSAEIIYQPTNGRPTKVRRASWLDESTYQLDFAAHDSHRLIIAFVPEWNAKSIFILTREMNHHNDDIENRIALLDGDHYNVKVRLINEAEGIVHEELDFSLVIKREPEIDIEFDEVKELTSKEIRQQLEAFLGEGSDLLKQFPRDKQATPEDIAKVDDWEQRAVRFLGRYPDLFSTTLFLSDFPEVPVAGGAQVGNWPSLKKLSRRLATLREFIDEQRRR